MSSLQLSLIPLFGVLASCWLVLSVYTLASRMLYDLRDRSVHAARDVLQPELFERGAREAPAQLAAILDGLPRRTIERVAADASAPDRLAEAFAARAVMGDGERHLLRRAASHRRELGRWRRIAALRILARARHEQAIPLLESALHEGDRELAGAAVAILGTVPDERAAAVLVHSLRAELYPPSRVATVLDGFPLPIDHLLRLLPSHPSAVVRFWGATLLSRYGGDWGVDRQLAALADDADPNVRAAAAESLAACPASKARDEAVSRLIGDRAWYVRAHAVRAAGEVGLHTEAERIGNLLADPEWWVRTAAKEALQAFGPRATLVLQRLLEHPDQFARNGAAEVLQNTGYVDDLVTDATEAGTRSSIELLARALEAGGASLRAAALSRLEADVRARLESRLEAALGVTEAA